MASHGSHSSGGTQNSQIDGITRERTLPTWMSPYNGELVVLQLRANKIGENDGSLPKNPWTLSKTIEMLCGKLEHSKSEDRGKSYALFSRKRTQVIKLLALTELLDGTKVTVTVHPVLNIRKIIVTCMEAIDVDENEIVQELAPLLVVNAYRIKKNVNGIKQNTPSIILTINGTVIPKYIYMGLNRVVPRVYYPDSCFNCYGYGHTAKKCIKKSVCRNCSKDHPETAGGCRAKAFCVNCRGNHSPMDKSCPVRQKEFAIGKLKVDKALNYGEAKRLYEAEHPVRTYASALKEGQTNKKCNCQCSCTKDPPNKNPRPDSNETGNIDEVSNAFVNACSEPDTALHNTIRENDRHIQLVRSMGSSNNFVTQSSKGAVPKTPITSPAEKKQHQD